jgi:hypothetical protein
MKDRAPQGRIGKGGNDCCALVGKIRGAINACLDLFVTFWGDTKSKEYIFLKTA